MKRKDSSKPGRGDTDYKSALQRAAALCSRQEQYTGKIRGKLEEWKVSVADAEKIINKLHEEKFLDDGRFATYFVRDKFRLNQWGKIKISHNLRQKGISDSIILQALDQIDENIYFDSCIELIRSKSATLKEKNYYTRKGKLFRFAAGRGFEPDLIHRALRIIEQE